MKQFPCILTFLLAVLLHPSANQAYPKSNIEFEILDENLYSHISTTCELGDLKAKHRFIDNTGINDFYPDDGFFSNSLTNICGNREIPIYTESVAVFSNDVGVEAILEPISGINLVNNIIVIKITNYGTEAQSNIPWEVSWSGPSTGNIGGTYANMLQPEQSVGINAGTVSLIMYGDYLFMSCTDLSGDQNPGNDCVTKTVSNHFQGIPHTNIYIHGCLWGDRFTSWNLANIDIPFIPCEGTPPWYQNYSNKIHAFQTGQTYVLTVTVGYADTFFDVWIDFNKDFFYDEPYEAVINDAFCPIPDTAYTFLFTIPTDAPAGIFYMRARTNWQSPVICPYYTHEYGGCCDFRAKVNTNPGQAQIVFDPDAITEIHTMPNAVTTQTILVSNVGNSLLNFDISVAPSISTANTNNQFADDVEDEWLSVDPVSGVISPNSSLPVTLTFNSNALSVGTYFSSLHFYSSAIGNPHHVPVSLHVDYKGMSHPTGVETLTENKTVTYNMVDLKPPDVSSSINIFPNPAVDVLNIEAKNINRIWVINSFGETVFDNSFYSDHIEINTISFRKGIYLIHVITDHHSYIEKLLIR